jgi:HrpA-like RNA helicase
MLSIGIRNVSTFDFLEPPPQEAVQSALRQLTLLGAIQSESETKPDQPQTAGNASSSVIRFAFYFKFFSCRLN